MGAPTSEVGYTIATTRKETTKVHKNMWWHWGGGGSYSLFYLKLFKSCVILSFCISSVILNSASDWPHIKAITRNSRAEINVKLVCCADSKIYCVHIIPKAQWQLQIKNFYTIYIFVDGMLHFVHVPHLGVGRDSSVGIATRYGLDGPGDQIPLGGEIFRTHLDWSWGPTQPPIRFVPALSRG